MLNYIWLYIAMLSNSWAGFSQHLFLFEIAEVTYHLTVFSRNILSERNLVHMTACIHGTHGDTGDRPLLWSLQNVQQGEDTEVLYTFPIYYFQIFLYAYYSLTYTYYSLRL